MDNDDSGVWIRIAAEKKRTGERIMMMRRRKFMHPSNNFDNPNENPRRGRISKRKKEKIT